MLRAVSSHSKYFLKFAMMRWAIAPKTIWCMGSQMSIWWTQNLGDKRALRSRTRCRRGQHQPYSEKLHSEMHWVQENESFPAPLPNPPPGLAATPCDIGQLQQQSEIGAPFLLHPIHTLYLYTWSVFHQILASIQLESIFLAYDARPCASWEQTLHGSIQNTWLRCSLKLLQL